MTSNKLPTVDELRAKITERGPWFDVPFETKDAECERCDADGLFWILTKNRKRMLVDCEVPGGKLPMLGAAGRGVSHFATCPHALHFQRRDQGRKR